MDKKFVLALVVIAFLAAALIFSGAFSKENTRDTVNPVGVNPIPTSITGIDTSASVSNWTLQSINLGDSITQKTNSYEVEVNGCASPEIRTFTCFAQTGGDITYRFTIEGKAGSEVFGGTFAFSPEVQSSISQIEGHSDSSQKTVELGFIDTIRVTDYQILKSGYGIFQDRMGQAITHNLMYNTGGCTLTVEVIKREVCEGFESSSNPPVVIEPTPQPQVVVPTSTSPNQAGVFSTSSVDYDGEYFRISQAPAGVFMSSVGLAEVVSQSQMNSRSSSDTYNTIGLGTQIVLADAGVYLTHDQGEAEINSSAALVTTENRKTLYGTQQSYDFAANSFSLLTAAGSTLKVGSYEIDTTPIADNEWFVVIANSNQDSSLSVSNYNPGYAVLSLFPSGQFLSEQYILDNVANSLKNNCDSNGCKTVRLLIFDADTGAWLVLLKEDADDPWTLIATNLTIN